MNETTKLAWRDGTPASLGLIGWTWIVNEDGDYAVVEIDADGVFCKPRGFGTICACAGPIEPPDESTLP